jgi:hypothetical protein
LLLTLVNSDPIHGVAMARPKHPKPEVEEAVQYAESKNWAIGAVSFAHKPTGTGVRWAYLECPEALVIMHARSSER